MNDITVIVPCFNEEKTIPIFHNTISDILNIISKQYGIEYKLLFVDDGSTDNTSELIQKLSLEHPNTIDYIVFSRNFGKESAIYAGLKQSKAEYTVIMDVDLQDPPELLEDMYLGIKKEGYDCVATRRKNRFGEPLIRSFFARIFYSIIRKLSGLPIIDGTRDFRMINRTMLNAILMIKESNRFSKGLFSWVGFKTKWLEYDNIERSCGNTKWSFTKLLFYGLDGIVAFSSFPLIIVSVFGILSMTISFIMIIFIIIKKIKFGDPVAGWPSMVCIMLFTSGLQYFFLGIIGFYVAKIYNETKNRPQYIIKKTSF